MVSKLVSRGRKQSEELVKELEALLEQARRRGRDRGTTRARRRREGDAPARAPGAPATPPTSRSRRSTRCGARRGVGPSFPITGYDELTAAQINRRLTDITKPDLRKVRTYEKNNKARKSVLAKIEKALG